MTQPDDTRIRLLTAMGWKQERRICDVGFIVSTDEERDGWLAPGGECWHEGEYLLPKLDANLLTAAREQLLTTEEEWIRYFALLAAETQYGEPDDVAYYVRELIEMEKLPPEAQARAILAVKEA